MTNRKIALFLILVFVEINIAFINENAKPVNVDVGFHGTTISDYHNDTYRDNIVRPMHKTVLGLHRLPDNIPAIVVVISFIYACSAFTPIKLSRCARRKVRSPSINQ